jgi:hypothetical protein
MILLLTLLPVVMLELVYLSPPHHSLDMAVATFIGNLLSVAATGFVLTPLVLCAFEWWVLPRPNDAPGVETAGVALIVSLYARLLPCSHGPVERRPVEHDRPAVQGIEMVA